MCREQGEEKDHEPYAGASTLRPMLEVRSVLLRPLPSKCISFFKVANPIAPFSPPCPLPSYCVPSSRFCSNRSGHSAVDLPESWPLSPPLLSDRLSEAFFFSYCQKPRLSASWTLQPAAWLSLFRKPIDSPIAKGSQSVIQSFPFTVKISTLVPTRS